MSGNASESQQQQQMEEIFICADVWHEVFAFLDPVDVGLKLALISDRLDVLVDVHFKSRKWSLGWLHILRATDGNGAQIVNKRSGEWLPIPQGPLPNKVIGFEGIWISYVDQTVIEFLQRIRRLFNSPGTNVDIGTSVNRSRCWKIIWQNIWPLVNDNICRFSLDSSQLDRLRQFSPAILRNCAKLRSIASFGLPRGLCPEFPAEDNAGASSTQAVAKWLITRRGDGVPKMLRCDFDLAFIICLHSPGIKQFELNNNLTGEQLTLQRRFNEDFKDKWLLVRCPIVREEDKWAKWEEEAIELDWYYQWNYIFIDFEHRDIGDGMFDAKAGPSKPPGK